MWWRERSSPCCFRPLQCRRGRCKVDYQVAGLLSYKIKPTVMLGVGWRYLDVNYRPSSSFVYDVAQSGLLLGVTFNLR